MTISTLTTQILQVARSARAGGQTIEIDYKLPTVAISRDEHDVFFFQEHEADTLLREAEKIIDGLCAGDQISVEDFLLYSSQGW
jgi:hypothetical protein